jgi:Spy/CpxP family protein refolding chaperone
MRKTRVIGFAVAAILTVGTVAQAQSSTQQPSQERRGAGRVGKDGPGRAGLFRGISLSDVEKGRVKEIHTKYSAEAKVLREAMRPAMQEARAARQNRDSAAVRVAWEKTAGDRQKLQALMQRERAEIRAALSPENQKVFDANAKALEERRAERLKNGKGGRDGRGGLRGHRGLRQS